MYRSALDRLKRAEDAYGREIWIETVGYDGRPDVYYRYDSDGRLMKHARKVFGYVVTPAEYSRFGEAVELELRSEN
jgi:hypothetical protein